MVQAQNESSFFTGIVTTAVKPSLMAYLWVKLALLVTLMPLSQGIWAATKKKVLVLEFINAESRANFAYLETSITEAVKNSLKKKFVFTETPKARWQKVAKDNYMYKEDYYSRTLAMNLGLLAKQDVVIAGEYRIDVSQKPMKVITNVRIVDIAKKTEIAQFTETGPAGSGIFATIEKIAARIAEEARAVLPSKEEWQRSGLTENTESRPWVDNWVVGLRVGASTYALGFAERITASQPMLGLITRAGLPRLWQPLQTQFEFSFFSHTPTEGKNPALEGLTVTTSNYALVQYLGIEFDNLFSNIGIFPKAGFGYVMQSTSVTGFQNTNLNNGFLTVALGLEVLYPLPNNLSAIGALQSLGEIESSKFTTYNSILLGINYSFR